jgi:hypothetical protein
VFFGHLAAGMAAKRVAPEAPLKALLVSSTAMDTLWGIFSIAGIEAPAVAVGQTKTIAWSHGLPMAVVWAIMGVALAYPFTRKRRASIVIGSVIFSHWVLDFVSLAPVLPLFFEGSPTVGLGLYSSMAVAVVADLGLLGAGIAIYLRMTEPRDAVGTWGFWSMLLFVVLLAVPAATPRLSLLPVLAIVLLFPFGNWVDRHRLVVAV